MITLYADDSDESRIIMRRLDKEHIEHSVITDENIIQQKHFTELPILDVAGRVMGFFDAMKWIG